MASAFDSVITANSFADPDIAACFSDEAEIQAILRFESELALAQEQLGILPQGSGAALAQSLSSIEIDPAKLTEGFQRDGILIPSLIAAIREQLPADIARYLHHGVTSQDAIDSGLVIRLKEISEQLLAKNTQVLEQLRTLAREHSATLTIARTRNQNAAPTVFGLKVVNWLEPLQRQQARLQELLPRLLSLQLGGGAGTMAALGPQAQALNSKLAEALGLRAASSPWHVQRDCIVEFANWLSMNAGLNGKMGQDMLLLAQSEVGELRFKGGGKSSTLPNKNNPVLPEFLAALNRHCQQLAGSLNHALVASGERDGVSMMLEQITLAPLVSAAAASMNHAQNALSAMEVDAAAMLHNIEIDSGRILAEAASFELGKTIARVEASKLVAQACRQSKENNSHMIDELSHLVDADIDWQSLKDPRNSLGLADQIIQKVLSE